MSDATAVTGLPGIGSTPLETRAELIVSVARTADRRGFGRVSIAEAMGQASPVLLAEIAAQTERVELATTVVPVGPHDQLPAGVEAAEIDAIVAAAAPARGAVGTPTESTPLPS